MQEAHRPHPHSLHIIGSETGRLDSARGRSGVGLGILEIGSADTRAVAEAERPIQYSS